MNTQKYSLLFFLLSLLIPPFFVECFFIRFLFRVVLIFAGPKLFIFSREPNFLLCSIFRLVLIFACPKWLKVSLFGKGYETKYWVGRLVIWHHVWRHVGLSDAKNSYEKGTESKKLFKFYCFFAMFLVPSFLFCAYLVFRR